MVPIRYTSSSPARRVSARRRTGLATAELALTLPILLIVLMAIFEFSLLFLARGELVDASREGARVAALPGANQESVEWAVRENVAPRFRNAVVVDVSGGAQSGELITVAVRVPMRSASPDLLWPVGYSLKDQTLVAETRILRE
jgi:hypothetical protein